jgi:hypothetical protein
MSGQCPSCSATASTSHHAKKTAINRVHIFGMHPDYTMHVNGMAVKVAAQLSTVLIYGTTLYIKG